MKVENNNKSVNTQVKIIISSNDNKNAEIENYKFICPAYVTATLHVHL
jgi:hypothetical protein